MYKFTTRNHNSLFEDLQPNQGGTKNEPRKIDWIEKSGMAPLCLKMEKRLCLITFRRNHKGNGAKPLRMALGSLFDSNRNTVYSDEETVLQTAQKTRLSFNSLSSDCTAYQRGKNHSTLRLWFFIFAKRWDAVTLTRSMKKLLITALATDKEKFKELTITTLMTITDSKDSRECRRNS